MKSCAGMEDVKSQLLAVMVECVQIERVCQAHYIYQDNESCPWRGGSMPLV